MPVSKNSKRAHFPYPLYLLAAVLFVFSSLAHADGIYIRSANTKLIDKIFRLDATIEYRLSEEALSALHNGVPLNFLIEIEVKKVHPYLWDDEIATLEQRYQLSYHALSRKYLLENFNSGSVFTFDNLQTAILVLGSLQDIPIIDMNFLSAPGSYYARLRAQLETDKLPAPLRALSYVTSGWRLNSEWYAWPLKD